MYRSITNGAAAILALYVPATNAFWRLECSGTVGMARIDPLMDFGGLSGHVHTIKGGSAFSSTSTADDLLKSKCQSCDVAQDKSAYWTPPLYFMADDGTMTLVPEKPPFKAYYELDTGLTSDGKPQTVEAFPKGFQMISGSNTRRNTTLSGPDPSKHLGPFPDENNSQREERAIGFNCLNYANPSLAENALSRHHLPEKSWIDSNCPDGIRLELGFPSCWNGEMDGGEEHKSHVAFPHWIKAGDCPPGFDKRLPTMLYETIVDTGKFIGKSGKFVLGNGDPTGYGYHGDFIAAWEEGILQQAVEQCTDKRGEMRKCGVFKYTDKPASCTLENLPSELKDENTEGPLQGLPGGCELEYGPEPANKCKGATGSSSGGKSAGKSVEKFVGKPEQVPAEGYSSPAEPAPAPIENELPAAPQKAAVVAPEVEDKGDDNGAPPPQLPPAAPATTPPPSADSAVAGQAGNIITTSLHTDGRVVYEKVVVKQEVTVTEGGVKAKRTPEAKAEHVKRHGHRHHHPMQHGVGGRRMK
ncbi:MAG: hypothetical protein LQ341_000203 [Variospora aurantia]|nr:MAG: hypothetical protein LQ341_000203 [Variospora aurantia]